MARDSALTRFRPGCLESASGGGYQITKQGLAEVFKQASLGATPTQVAAHLRVGVDWVRRRLDPDHELFDSKLYDAYHEGRSELVTRLRENQLAMSESNAQMAIHLGKHYLDQHDRPVEHNHRHMVVGTMPDYEQTPEDWKRQFAPTALQVAAGDKTIDVEDAEVIDDETG